MELKSGINLTEGFKFDNEFHRWGDKKEFWATGREWEYKGNSYSVIYYGNWKTDEAYVWKSFDDKNQSAGFHKKQNKILQELNVLSNFEKEKKHKQCRDDWKPRWDSMQLSPDVHPYLTSKGLDSNYSAKRQRDSLFIEAFDINGFNGVQIIYPQDGKYIKRFSTGIQKKFSISVIPNKELLSSADVVYLSEGFATAASVYEATKEVSVISFDAGNLQSAIKTIRQFNPTVNIIICADSDEVGIKKAFQCKGYFNGVSVRVPVFQTRDDSKTDFNDLHQSEGIEVVSSQLAYSDDEFIVITPLGYLEGNYYYTSTLNNQIVSIASSKHRELDLFSLAPLSYWKKRYELQTKEDKTPWKLIASDLMESCHKEGLFNPEKIRGRGVWKDGNYFVINNGETVINSNPESSYHYQKLNKVDFSTDNPFTQEEMMSLYTAIKLLRYKNKNDFVYICSWIIQSQIPACLSWRPYLWVTGEAGSGKTTILEWIKDLSLLNLYTRNATAAGIKQKAKNDVMPVIYDESETNEDRMNAVIELARQTSSNNEAKELRGSSSGKSQEYNYQLTFLFGSVQAKKFNQADSSRVFLVEMDSTLDQSVDEYKKIEIIIKFFIENKVRLFARAYKMIPVILQSFENCKNHLKKKRMESRMADQFSAMVSCLWVYLSDEAISDDDIDNVFEEFKLMESSYSEESAVKESTKCYQDIMQTIISQKDGWTVSTAISRLNYIKEKNPSNDLPENDPSYIKDLLGSYGLKYLIDENSLFIAKQKSNLDTKLKNYPWYYQILMRDKTLFIESSVQRINALNPKNSVRGIKINLI